MSIDWTKYKAEDVKNGLDQNGNRLFSLFVQDYIKVFGVDVCPNCKDFPVKFQNYLNKTAMSKESKFQLKKMYEGLPLEFGSQVYVTNANITDENALQLIKNHPRGKELFEVLPDNVNELLGAGNKSDKPAAVKMFDKDFSIEEVKSLFDKAGIKSNATSLNGLQKAFDGLSAENKKNIEDLLPVE